uniref:Secreted protein n=1 Tax=Vespula pensylvanica TaxID=30213 RepID=A0A834U9Q3_VESPE|nr:hypothetical protein H0235_009038 [Vespula pensylvanica]
MSHEMFIVVSVMMVAMLVSRSLVLPIETVSANKTESRNGTEPSFERKRIGLGRAWEFHDASKSPHIVPNPRRCYYSRSHSVKRWEIILTVGDPSLEMPS